MEHNKKYSELMDFVDEELNDDQQEELYRLMVAACECSRSGAADIVDHTEDEYISWRDKLLAAFKRTVDGR